MNDMIFVDSNIWLYAAIEDESNKSISARQVIEQNNIVISVQVINEISFNLLRKYHYTEHEVTSFIHRIKACCQVCYVGVSTCLIASSLRQRYTLSFWDSLIVSSALETQCSILYSEDMQHGIYIQNMRIINPFK